MKRAVLHILSLIFGFSTLILLANISDIFNLAVSTILLPFVLYFYDDIFSKLLKIQLNTVGKVFNTLGPILFLLVTYLTPTYIPPKIKVEVKKNTYYLSFSDYLKNNFSLTGVYHLVEYKREKKEVQRQFGASQSSSSNKKKVQAIPTNLSRAAESDTYSKETLSADESPKDVAKQLWGNWVINLILTLFIAITFSSLLFLFRRKKN